MQLENYFLGRKLIRSRPALFPFASYVFRFSFEFENAVVPVPTPLCTYARVSRGFESQPIFSYRRATCSTEPI